MSDLQTWLKEHADCDYGWFAHDGGFVRCYAHDDDLAATLVTVDSLTELMWELVRHVNDDLHQPFPIHAATAAKFIIAAAKEAERE